MGGGAWLSTGGEAQTHSLRLWSGSMDAHGGSKSRCCSLTPPSLVISTHALHPSLLAADRTRPLLPTSPVQQTEPHPRSHSRASTQGPVQVALPANHVHRRRARARRLLAAARGAPVRRPAPPAARPLHLLHPPARRHYGGPARPGAAQVGRRRGPQQRWRRRGAGGTLRPALPQGRCEGFGVGVGAAAELRGSAGGRLGRHAEAAAAAGPSQHGGGGGRRRRGRRRGREQQPGVE